jgi:glycosyltransferase involved in cell wall biosynthesis
MHLLNLPVRHTRSPGRGPVSVCFVIDRLSRAGTETQLLALLRHLDRGRVRPSLCLLNGADPESQSLLPSDCPTLDLGLDRLLSPAAAGAAARLAGFWRRHRVDVVQTYFLDSTYFAAPLARMCGIRQVVRVRNNSGYWLTGWHRWLGRLAGRVANVTLTNSETAADSVWRAEGLPPGRVRVIENGVDVDRFEMLQPPDTDGPIVRVGAVANLRQVKNVDGLIRVAADLCRNDHRVRFEVAGDGAERPRLERQIRDAGLGERFALRGAVSDVPGFLYTIDVAVLPSHSESMSNALLEYMAAGRAIVATDVGANAQVIRDGRDGLIVPAQDDAALGRAIRRFLHEPALARAMGAAARHRAAAEFSRAAMIGRFETFFASLLTSRPAA